jgi:hypothetical protein
MGEEFPEFANVVVNRDPRVFPYGLYVADMCAGIGVISWFKDVDEMMEYLLKTEPIIWDYEGETLDHYTKNILKISGEAKSSGLNEELRVSANKLVASDFEIEWWGTFDELLKGEDEITKNIREEFLDIEEGGSNSDIPDESIGAFIEWLKTFRC